MLLPRTASSASAGTPPAKQPRLPVNLVIARYNEDVPWLQDAISNLRAANYEPKTFLYNNGPEFSAIELANNFSDARVTRLPNIGREAHVYLHHMAAIESDDSDHITVYTQAHPHVNDVANSIVRMADEAALRGVSSPNFGVWANGGGQEYWATRNFTLPWMEDRARDREALGPWFDRLFSGALGGVILPDGCALTWSIGANFAVHSALQLPRALLQACVAETASSSNPEVGHYFERIWIFVFRALRDCGVPGGAAPRAWAPDDPGSMTLPKCALPERCHRKLPS